MDGRLGLSEYLKLTNDAKFQLLKNIFEDSPWVVKRGLESTEQFSTVADLFHHFHDVFASATAEEKLGVLRAHPDLVGNAALQGRLTKESTQEQKGAGLGDLSDEEIEFFQEKNEAYKTKFGFPFIICVKYNKKEAIKESMPKRLENTYEVEFETALHQVKLIAEIRINNLLID